MHSHVEMFRPVLGSLNKIVEEAVPGFLDENLEAGILFLVNHLYKEPSLAAPEETLKYYTGRKLMDAPTVA